MTRRWSRRDALKGLGACAIVSTRSPSGADRAAFRRPGGSLLDTSAPEPLTVAGKAVQVSIVSATAATVRISLTPLENAATLDDDRLAERQWPAPAARVTSLPHPGAIRAGDLTVTIEDPLVISIDRADGHHVQRLTIDRETGAMAFRLGDTPLLGIGEGGPQFDRRGSIDPLKSGQGGYRLRTHGGRVPIPWLVGTGGWAMFVHHPFGSLDTTGPTDGRFVPAPARPLPLDVFVVGAREPAAIMAEYAKLTGYPEMPPLWSLGYQQSHRTLASRDEILDEAKTFREKKLPCDALIYLGTGFCPSGWNTDNGEFAFNPKVFPDPAAMFAELHGEHFKVVLHVVLEGHRLSGTVADKCTAPPLPSGRTADGKWPDDRQVACYWPAHQPLFDLGVDGWWPDQGDGLDEASRLARIRMYWDGCRAARPNERPYALHRNGAAAMQRYGAFLWSGDVYSTWETLQTHVPVAVNTALSGVPFWGTDIGGFVPTKELTGELYVRWFQFGAFCPLFRSHGRDWKLRLPWGWNTGDLGPNELSTYTNGAANPDPSELHDAAVEPICRKYLDLRMRLMPYLYSVVHEAHATGLPILRALWLHYPGDPVAVARGDEYLWGRDILVAPVVEKGAKARRLYLPHGIWYDFWLDERFDGGREHERTVDLETMPLFVRAGTVLPLGPVRQYTSEVNDEPIALQIYPGADGEFALYEDDGMTFDYRRGDWTGIQLRWSDAQRRLTVRLAADSRMRGGPRRFLVRAVGGSAIREVRFSGQPTEVTL